MHKNKIIYLLSEAEQTQLSISKRLNVKPSSVSRVISGEVKSQRIAKEVCRVIKKPMTEVFPNYKAA